VAAWRGYTEKLRVDNGPELTSVKLAEWAEEHSVSLEFIQLGKPTQNSFIERFNGAYRNEVSSAYVFTRLSEVRRITENWLIEYNKERPHESLGNMTPAEFLASVKPLDTSI
jgi:putative transposase